MNIVTITIDKLEKYNEYSDIVIDFLSPDDKKYFTGRNYSIRRNGDLEIDEIVNLIIKLEWDSNFFGFNVSFLSCMHLTDNIMLQIKKFIVKEKIRLVEYLCNCHDRRSVVVAEKNDFHFTDMRLTYKRKLEGKEEVSLDDWIFAKATGKDTPKLREMSKDIYRDSRYFFDGNFDVAKINEFYQSWVEKGVHGQYDDECWCLYDDVLPIAFCTVRYAKPESATIGLFGVDKRYQRKRLGKKLLYSVFNMLFDRGVHRIFVVTQGRNYAAQNLYQSVGFRTESTQLWYHKWI